MRDIIRSVEFGKLHPGLVITEKETGLSANCHSCGSESIELVHVHDFLKHSVHHDCPNCGNRVGVNGALSSCNACDKS